MRSTSTNIDPFYENAIENLSKVIDEVLPLSNLRRSRLSKAIHDLSTILTTKRYMLKSPYWSNASFASAYVRYFLPWNLIRLHSLLSKIPQPIASHDKHIPIMLDLGSGPLTFPIALFISNKQLRETPLTVICTDTCPYPMRIGECLIKSIAKFLDIPFIWNLKLYRQNIAQTFLRINQPPAIITASNIMNEWETRSTSSRSATVFNLENFVSSLANKMNNDSIALFVEPGNRLGGTLCAQLRSLSISAGLLPMSPCTHSNPCPLLDKGTNGWCHLHEDIDQNTIPSWLKKISMEASLPKTSFSYSHVLLAKNSNDDNHKNINSLSLHTSKQKKDKYTDVRIISDAFFTSRYGSSSYGCSEHGLILIPNPNGYPWGSLVKCFFGESFERDEKSGAIVAKKILD